MLKKTLILLSLATIFPSMAERSGTLITQVDMTQDSAKEYQSAKKTLNETYQKVSKAVKGEQKTLLKKSQDA
nr:lysozyme inhibitor LprI family protein [Candidatus Hamiltonella defensa]